MRAGEVDDDRVARWVDRRRLLVSQAEEEDVGVGCERLLVSHERGQLGVHEARVERGRGPPRQRVGAERDRLELRVRENAVERLLTRVAGTSDDRCPHRHLRIMQNHA